MRYTCSLILFCCLQSSNELNQRFQLMFFSKNCWKTLQVKEYVSTRVSLKRVCLLIDTKWGVKPRDHELISLMERYGLISWRLILLSICKWWGVNFLHSWCFLKLDWKAEYEIDTTLMVVDSIIMWSSLFSALCLIHAARLCYISGSA